NKEYGENVAKLNTKSPGQHYLSVNVLKLANEKQIDLQLNLENSEQSIASEETIEKVKEVIERMGIHIQELNKYAKQDKLDISGVNAVADVTRGIIAIAEGKEEETITEETVHIAIAILEQTNPKMV